MSSHNSAIASRTDLNPVVSSQSPYIATVVGRLCCTRLLIHYNASPPNPCRILFGKPGVGSVSQSSIIFASCIFGFTFPCGCISELTAWTLYLPMKLCCLCLVDGYGCPSCVYNIGEFVRQHS